LPEREEKSQEGRLGMKQKMMLNRDDIMSPYKIDVPTDVERIALSAIIWL